MNSFWLVYSRILRYYGHVIWPARGTQFDLPLQMKVLFGTFFPSGHTNVGTFPFLHLTLHFFVVQFTSTAASGTSNCSKTVVSHFVTYDDFKIKSRKYFFRKDMWNQPCFKATSAGTSSVPKAVFIPGAQDALICDNWRSTSTVINQNELWVMWIRL